jgi:uronate dehydrogenase
MKRILLTGGGGGVGRMIRPLLSARYGVRVSDRVPIAHEANEEHIVADLGDMEAVRRAVRGVDGIVHLGGYSVESDFGTILAANIVGAHNLFEAARLEGVRRMVFASSNHVMGFYPRTEKIAVDRTVRPDSRYGVSKAFGEALASLYADKYGAECLVVRIGHVAPRPENPRDLAVWLSPRDFVQLIAIGIERAGLRYEIVYGMSDNARAWWDDSAARALGYRPDDRSEDYAVEVLTKGDGPTGDPLIDLHQGGAFAAAEDMKPASSASRG